MTRHFVIGAAAGAILTLLVAPARAQTTTAPSQPTTNQAQPPAADHVKEIFEQYSQGEERSRFFAAAGVDGELSQEEFAAAAGKADSLVRPHDRWEAALACDKDASGKLNWPEWEAYRLSIRRLVLAHADANKDGQLTGAERDEANRFLSAGLKSSGPTVAAGPADSFPRGQDALANYDKDGDGRLSEQERRAMMEDYAQRTRLRRWDANRDGRLDEQETSAMQAETARLERQLAQARQRQQEAIQKYDKDGDGRLDPEESRSMLAETRQQWELRRYDTNNDGALDEQETAARNAERQQWRRDGQEARQRWEELRAKYDADKDGRLSSQERSAMLQEMRQQWELRRHDRNNDGVLDEQEAAARDAERQRAEEMRRRWEDRRKEMDADGDGQVSPEEGRQYWEKLRRQYDANGDGELSPEERREMYQKEYGTSGPLWRPGGGG